VVDLHLLARLYRVLPTEILRLTPLEWEINRRVAAVGAKWEDEQAKKKQK
jgi:hypothetical protein